MIPQAKLESSKSKIFHVISSRVLLKQQGQSWIGLCPFHNETTASFSVSESKGRFKCFSCGVSGDTIDFLRRFHKTDFRRAVAMLGVAEDASLCQNSIWRWNKVQSERRKAELKAEWNQLAAGLRYIGRLIARTEPLERESDWFTAELALEKKLDDLYE